MASEPDPDRLRALEDRLAQLKTVPKQEKQAMAKGFSQGEIAWRMVVELASGIMVGFAIGYGLDSLFGTMPIFLVIFTLFGFAAGVKTLLGTAKEAQERQLAEANRDANAAAGAAKDEGN